ncbi:General negative regulator of transcription subunit 4 [Quillaja saponaria]|uniref:General negative regulator of transcription subunit 4 n=1 Tax=Quillaja saponaria TaxID=32244 RepID=A0AAD7P8S2_QUISA|nr:General negative regulator of transcription subunit 4 [Quillaja saponaria]
MVSDSFTTAASIPSAPNTKNLGKKKRINRSAKLKQCKFDARREQWLSQGAVKNKGCNDGRDDVRNPLMHMRKGCNGSLEKLEMRISGQENDGLIHQDSDLESTSISPTSFNCGVLSSNDSGTNFTGSSSSSSSSSSGGCFSGNITEEEGDDGCLDDWEAVADALAAHDKHQNLCHESPPAHEPVEQMVSPTNGLGSGGDNSKHESARLVPRDPGNTQAWSPDDAFRPQSLPNLSKQHSLANSDWHYGGGVPWAATAVTSVPSSCPICYEDLDLTDTSFLPCFCGFRLCLFCHKRILEEDGRCPGCRKPYERDPVETEASVHGGSLTFRLARSCSMIERS